MKISKIKNQIIMLEITVIDILNGQMETYASSHREVEVGMGSYACIYVPIDMHGVAMGHGLHACMVAN